MSTPNPQLPADWPELSPLVDRLLDAAPDRRSALLAELSAGDPVRRAELERLVAECERELPLLERPAVERFHQLAGDDPGPPLPPVLGGRYRIEREVGSGGMARVYLAQDLKHARHVAVKVIRPELAASLGRERFLREIGIAARLRHPNIMPLYDSGDTDGVLYFVMPYESGLSLRARLEDNGGLPIAEAVSILRDVARALAYAHEQGIVHRDVKPDNVLLSGDAAVVTDFGIAKAFSAALTEAGASTITQVGAVIGTPAYMAPEQATGDAATDHRADIYSFGCLAYEAFTGKTPFPEGSTHQVIAAHLGTAARPVTESRADVPQHVAGLIAQCLEKNPAARPQNARDLLATLDGTGIPSGATAAPARTRPRALKWAGLVLTAGLLSTGAYFATRHPAVTPPAPVTIAVLPFNNISRDSSIDFAEGLADDLFSALAKVPGIAMKSRTGSLAYQGQLTVDVTEAGAKLKADFVIQGVIRQVRGRWILSVDLQRAAAATYLWVDKFSLGRDQQAAVVGDITGRLARVLRDSFPGSIGPVLAAHQTSNVEAYLLYLRGLEQFNHRSQSVRESAELFRQAIHQDTLYAGAYAGLSLALALTPRLQQVSPVPFIPGARAAAQRALQLDSTLSGAHVALGMVAEYGLQWDQAEQEYRTALQLDSHDVEARIQYAGYLRIRSRRPEAMRQLQLARDDDPASAVVASHLSMEWYMQGQLDSALAETAHALQLDANNLTAVALGAQVLLGAGKPQEAHQLILRLPKRSPLALYVLAATGDSAGALERLKVIENTRPPPDQVNSARAYAMFGWGDTAQALTALERATENREMWFWGLSPSGPLLRPVRGSARFEAILRRVGLSRR